MNYELYTFIKGLLLFMAFIMSQIARLLPFLFIISCAGLFIWGSAPELILALSFTWIGYLITRLLLMRYSTQSGLVSDKSDARRLTLPSLLESALHRDQMLKEGGWPSIRADIFFMLAVAVLVSFTCRAWYVGDNLAAAFSLILGLSCLGLFTNINLAWRLSSMKVMSVCALFGVMVMSFFGRQAMADNIQMALSSDDFIPLLGLMIVLSLLASFSFIHVWCRHKDKDALVGMGLIILSGIATASVGDSQYILVACFASTMCVGAQWLLLLKRWRPHIRLFTI